MTTDPIASIEDTVQGTAVAPNVVVPAALYTLHLGRVIFLPSTIALL